MLFGWPEAKQLGVILNDRQLDERGWQPTARQQQWHTAKRSPRRLQGQIDLAN
jgi:hypothetical protein